jgi:hypothetical protein
VERSIQSAIQLQETAMGALLAEIFAGLLMPSVAASKLLSTKIADATVRTQQTQGKMGETQKIFNAKRSAPIHPSVNNNPYTTAATRARSFHRNLSAHTPCKNTTKGKATTKSIE